MPREFPRCLFGFAARRPPFKPTDFLSHRERSAYAAVQSLDGGLVVSKWSDSLQVSSAINGTQSDQRIQLSFIRGVFQDLLQEFTGSRVDEEMIEGKFASGGTTCSGHWTEGKILGIEERLICVPGGVVQLGEIHGENPPCGSNGCRRG
jgi:hypothetical protein